MTYAKNNCIQVLNNAFFQASKKAAKYGLPIAALGVAGYAVSRGQRRAGSSSSSSDSD